MTGAAQRRAGIAILFGCVIGALAGPVYARAISGAFSSSPTVSDPQGAIAFLPAFQIGLYAALCVAVFEPARWRLIGAGLALVALSQGVMFALLQVLVRFTGLVPHVRDIRAWALAGPVLVVTALAAYDRPRR